MFASTKSARGSAGLTDPNLWARIRLAPLPVTCDGAEFARALANAHDMPLRDAREVEQEYRRFLYLAAVSEAQRVAPVQVRLAWQLHASAPDYAAFCNGVLQKPLPLDDTSRMLGAAAAYQQTRSDYSREFGQEPTRFVWPEGITPRMPRWLTEHAAILGFTGAVAWGQREPLIFAAGLGLTVALYGYDLWSSRYSRHSKGLGEAMTSDLSYWLHRFGN